MKIQRDVAFWDAARAIMQVTWHQDEKDAYELYVQFYSFSVPFELPRFKNSSYVPHAPSQHLWLLFPSSHSHCVPYSPKLLSTDDFVESNFLKNKLTKLSLNPV